MDESRRMHLCGKTSYTSGKEKYILFEEGKFYESRKNLIYDPEKNKYSDPIHNRYRIYFDKSYADVFTKECVENLKLGIDEALDNCYMWADVKDLEKYSLTTYTIKEYTALFREDKINKILDMKAAFFGGAKRDITSQEYIDSIRIGEILSNAGYIVKNGGYHGLMEAVSIGSRNAIGYTCMTIGPAKGNDYLDKTVVCDDIYDRLRHLIEETDLFIVQKGGLGTLAELFLTLDIVRKLKQKPRILLIGEFWKHFMSEANMLMNYGESEMYIIIENIEDINDWI